MLTTVFTKSILDRWRGMTIGSVTLAIFFLFGMVVYKDIDLGFYDEFPEAVRSMMSMPQGADVGSLAYGAIYGLYGALVLAVLAIMAGSASIAGEERNGTLGLLLGNPRSRAHVLLSKTTALVLLIALATVVLWAAGRIIPVMLDVEVAGMHIEALLFHLFVNSIFYGLMATAIGAWTGNSGTASGATAAVMIVSMLAAGLLPFISGIESAAQAFPWHYFNSSEPVINGIDWGHMGVLLTGSAIFVIAAVIGVNRRDLKAQAVGTSLVDRLRANPMTQKMMDRIAGSARVSHIWVKTTSEYQVLLVATIYYMFLVGGIIIGPMYGFIDESILELSEQLPETLMALAGGGDMSRVEGFYTVETFSMMAPIIFMVLTVVMGSRALAGEESKRTMGLLLANPISRSRIVYEKMLAMVVLTTVLGIATFAGTAIGFLLGGHDTSYVNIAAISLLVTLLGLAFGALALALSAATGQVRIAVFGTVGPALVFYLLDSFLPLNDKLAGYAKWSPFYYYSGSDPLNNGMNWGHGALLAALTAVFVILAVALFNRRDLRQTG